MTIDTTNWHNTGGNGKASAVWVLTRDNRAATIEVMPYRCLVTMYVGRDIDEDYDGVPFPTLTQAQRWVESWLARQATVSK